VYGSTYTLLQFYVTGGASNHRQGNALEPVLDTGGWRTEKKLEFTTSYDHFGGRQNSFGRGCQRQLTSLGVPGTREKLGQVRITACSYHERNIKDAVVERYVALNKL
jgi:hypothetical protein